MKRTTISTLFHAATALSLMLCLATAKGQTPIDSTLRRPHRPFFDNQHPSVHDPVMAWDENGQCYIFHTGMGISCLSSTDMKNWHEEPSVFAQAPSWATSLIHGYHGHTWAPDITHIGNKWYLYYSCSTFGSNTSAIGLAINKTLNRQSPDFGWEDKGLVIHSERGKNNWNAIDPALIIDRKGKPWLAFGSFWDGIQIVPLNSDMQTPKGTPRTIARRRNPEALRRHEGNSNAIEAPFIIHHQGYYYLFVSFDYCCRGLQSTYKTAVGRARKVTGPYLDREGKKMLDGGGTIIAGPDSEYAGIGHCGVYQHRGQWWFEAHGYDKARNGQSKLYLKPMHFEDGWPVIK